jgi:2-polyprenyl-6-methoxyphenol hydroxylase-like FAD-dependent oxidoreductase
MPGLKPITIVGGGLAGLTLGVGLRRRAIPVTIYEAGHYPRHRVCGEFINGHGQDVLAHLGLTVHFQQAGAVGARTAAFCSSTAMSPIRTLARPALCLSRYSMDAALADQFRHSGGVLQEGVRWREAGAREGVVLANGRQVCSMEKGRRWFGLKVHARNVSLAADLEMHLLEDGYVGLCGLKGNIVNVCGLFRRRAEASQGAFEWRALLRGAPGTSLSARLASAIFDETTFCSVAGLRLAPQRATARQECALGDALTMIPPVTGNGMSMAFESAALAMEPLAAYSRGEAGWAEARQAVAKACDRAFASRLAWARWLQWMMFAPIFRGCLGAWALRSAGLWQTLFARTR